jgi:5-methylthioribose kinase
VFEITSQNAQDYLEQRGIASIRITELAGGVSSTVLRVETASAEFVIKQALGRLKVEQEWLSDRARIHKEAAALRRLAPGLPRACIPEVLWEDPANCIFAMTAASKGAVPWKTLLLRGETDPSIASMAGNLLGVMISNSWNRSDYAAEFGDQTVFDQLRLDPYYRTTARRHPGLTGFFESLIEDCQTNRVCLVHGDWSPKNLLACGGGVMAIDFEVIHFGNPSFDSAFLLNHLLLKSFLRPEYTPGYRHMSEEFWRALVGQMPECGWFESATIRHMGGLMLARVDGKSPAEYLHTSDQQQQVRALALTIIQNPPVTVDEIWRRRTA